MSVAVALLGARAPLGAQPLILLRPRALRPGGHCRSL